jgi:hypothetical protein
VTTIRIKHGPRDVVVLEHGFNVASAAAFDSYPASRFFADMTAPGFDKT